MLRPTPYPDDFPDLAKTRAHKQSAAGIGGNASFYRTPINVSFESGTNHVGVHQEACNGCGDCVTGCNFTSKNTLMFNYLPDARNHGAEIFCEVEVRRVARHGERFLIYYRPLGTDRETFDGPELFVSADVVFLSAGTLGSTEVLLRSKSAGLACSDRVGDRFTGNGDVLGFGYNTDQRIHGIGNGDKKTDPEDPIGPCITSVIDLRQGDSSPEDGMVIEEGSIPGALAPILPGTLQTAAKLTGQDTDGGWKDSAEERLRQMASMLPGGAYRGAVANTQIYLIMAHDDGAGRLKLDADRIRIDWPGLGQQPVFKRAEKALVEATEALGGTYVPSPTFNAAFGYDLITVHPLGGCCMGEDSGTGVVNHKGQVFAASSGEAVYEGFYIADGSVLPRPVGVNPLLTISAVAERNAYLAASDRGWTLDETMPGGAARYDGTWQPDDKLRIQFTERMAGHCSTTVLDDYEGADGHGKSVGNECSFLLTIVSDDVAGMVDDTEHAATIIGSVHCPVLHPSALTVSGGRFNLFSPSSDEAGLKLMRYRFNLTSEDGKRYYFNGFKRIRNDSGVDVWTDTTTLFITIHEGEDDTGTVAAKGKLYIAPEDFMRQMTTMKAHDSSGKVSLAGTAKFGNFFAAELWDTYGVEVNR